MFLECMATIGQVGNLDHEQVSLGKAGRKRWLGRRPTVRGVAMNPVDHPLGGGEGKASGGRHPCTPWGKPTKGYKTRKNKTTDRYILVITSYSIHYTKLYEGPTPSRFSCRSEPRRDSRGSSIWSGCARWSSYNFV